MRRGDTLPLLFAMSKTPPPHSIGLILDGNRRWAKERGLASLAGHRVGLEKIKEVVEWAEDAGIQEIIVYAFSSENWEREKTEVEYLMELAVHAFGAWANDIVERGIQVRFIGERNRLPLSVLQTMESLEERTKDATGTTLIFAMSYGGRSEILSAINTLLCEGKRSATEEDVSRALWTAGLSDPELIIRTGGEKRLSNFLPWQSVYSELFFTDTKWPDFSKEEFKNILAEFSTRERRHGR